jgi:flagellar motility protein MotE (MotC chaperone)
MKIKVLATIIAGLSAAVTLSWLYVLDTRPVFAEQAQSAPQTALVASAPAPAPEKGILAVLSRKEKELQAREEELVRNEERLNIVKADIEKRLGELKAEHEEIAALVKKIDEINDQRNKKIVKIYESMNPEEAADRIEKLDEEMAVMILASMSERKAAKVLSFVDISKSAKLSQSLRVKN